MSSRLTRLRDCWSFEVDSGTIARALSNAAVPPVRTPARIFLSEIAESNFDQLAILQERAPPLRVAYSVKTNPRNEVLDLVRRADFFVEVISVNEWAHAQHNGFAAAGILYNGPWPVGDLDVAVAFADSHESFQANALRRFRFAHGLRIRPPEVRSRFGVPATELDREIDVIGNAAPIAALAVSFFVRSEDLDGKPWSDVALDVVQYAARLERTTGKPVLAIDLGGGCSPREFQERVETDFPLVIAEATSGLPNLSAIFIEPGQEVVSPVEAVVASVLEVRAHKDGARDIVLDTATPAVPHAFKRPHRAFVHREMGWHELQPGPDRMLGSVCLEEDVLRSELALPPDTRPGDLFVIADTGAYDSSMAYNFAKGRSRPEPP